MPQFHIEDIELTGTLVKVYVSTGNGTFSIKLPAPEEGEREENLGHGETLEAAKNSARAALSKRKVKVEVPFILEDGRRGVADSRHARNRTVLCTIGDHRDELPGRATVFQADTPDVELKRFIELTSRITELAREAKLIEEEWTFDIGRAVDRAVEEKLAEGVPA